MIFTRNRLEVAHKISWWLFKLVGQVAKGRGVTEGDLTAYERRSRKSQGSGGPENLELHKV